MTEGKIICAAIHFDDGKEHVHQPKNITTGFVITGRRHHNVYATFKALGISKEKIHSFKYTQGFITKNNYFLDREDAAIVAFSLGQISSSAKALYSEDLY